MDSVEFKRFNIDQVELLTKPIFLKPGKQTKGDKKVSVIHVIAPEDEKSQVRKMLKAI